MSDQMGSTTTISALGPSKLDFVIGGNSHTELVIPGNVEKKLLNMVRCSKPTLLATLGDGCFDINACGACWRRCPRFRGWQYFYV